MRRLLYAAVLLSGCAWSNSLYQARVLSGDALRAERENRPQDAVDLWFRAEIKADSVLGRNPTGKSSVEARWLRGRAFARVRDCPHAIPDLQGALIERPEAAWHESLLLELARCKEVMGDPSAGEMFLSLTRSRNSDTRREAGLRAAHWLLSQGRFEEALKLLAGFDTRSARLDRAAALSGLGRPDSAMAELDPLLQAGDTTVAWGDLLGMIAQYDVASTDSLLARLLVLPKVKPDSRARWVLDAAKGAALIHDEATTDRLLQQLLAMPAGLAVNEGRTMAAQRRFSAAQSVAVLRADIDTITGGRGLEATGLGGFQLEELLRNAGRIIQESGNLTPATPEGDLIAFLLAESARDSLHAPRLAAGLFARMEREWPASPYVPKALLARINLEADSAEALRARFAAHGGSPYVAFVLRQQDSGITALEDSLQAFSRVFFRRSAVPVDRLLEAPRQ